MATVVASACGDGDAATTQDASGRVRVTYAASAADIARFVRSEGVADSVADEVSAGIRLPEDLVIAMGAGDGTPRFTYDTRTISVPWSFVELVRDRLATQGYRDSRLQQGVVEVLAFVLTHEMAHALIDTLDLPIVGHEEDAADDFAAIIAVGYAQDEHIVTATSDFLQATGTMAPAADAAYFDEHSLDLQRFYSINCLMYGSDPERFAELARSTGMPHSRLASCVTQWTNTVRSWIRILAPFTKAGAIS